MLISRLVSWVDDLGAALLGRSVGTAIWRTIELVTVRRWSGVAVPIVSVLPVSSVPEVFDRWSAGERSELIGSEFLDVLASVPDPGTHAVGGIR
ncbi:hypothetical protein I551_8945 [Mycobacterium ulcerans str. Harvey]|uniref:Uncharacterized protein n=1 Tax=Mycobacterium ulcerans str. Harvey TaxID=1299332 RepID=A0ABN0R9G0_MYCUL|nr:hypothetical protein I551_8945 [Mycobacterium ulcerans str. Harvey]